MEMCEDASFMTDDPLTKLRAATAAEKAAIAERAERCKKLTAKISRYQVGKGPEPTAEEFSEWQEHVEQSVSLKMALI